MIVYHEIRPAALGTIRREGLKRTSRGAKGDDSAIIKTDAFLDERCPEELRNTGVSRDNNAYGYMSDGEKIIDIRDGKVIRVDELNKQSDQVLLKLIVDPGRCYVSDIDAYDRVKSAIEDSESHDELVKLAKDYWNKVRRLDQYPIRTFRRPELMITYDIEPGQIAVIKA